MSGASTATASADDLPLHPFTSLRARYGMLLGEDDFRVLMGHPRGKLMLHAAWLHGRGVVWGCRVAVTGAGVLEVAPGLAVDGQGRELPLGQAHCLDLATWVRGQAGTGEPVDVQPAADRRSDVPGRAGDTSAGGVARAPRGVGERQLSGYVVARPSVRLAESVPSLADPGDLSRRSTDYSRAWEQVTLELSPGVPGAEASRGGASGRYHRLRVLLGLAEVGDCDPAGEAAREAAREIAEEPASRRPAALLRAFRALAAEDVADLPPPAGDGEGTGLFPPVGDGVVLARVDIVAVGYGGQAEVHGATVDHSVRESLIATSALQELACGLAPGLLGEPPAAGPPAPGPLAPGPPAPQGRPGAGAAPDARAATPADPPSGEPAEGGSAPTGDLAPPPTEVGTARPAGSPDASRAPRDLPGVDAGGPRVEPEVSWPYGDTLRLRVTRPLVGASLTERSVAVVSLTDAGWVREDIGRVVYDGERTVDVLLHGRPPGRLARVIVRGTGPTPVMGADPTVPLAGLTGGPPGTEHDGHDAVLTIRTPEAGRDPA